MRSPVAYWFEGCRNFIVSGGDFTSQQIEYAPSYTSGFIVFQFTYVTPPTPAYAVGGPVNASARQLVLYPGFPSTVVLISGIMAFLLSISLRPKVAPIIAIPSTQYGSLPPPITLYGHEGLIQEILDVILLGSSGVKSQICLRGAPGIGKTTIATTIIYEPRIVDYFGNARHWVWCQEASNTAATLKAEKVLEYVADSLGIELKPSSDRKKDIRFFLKTHNVPRIIIFDNFETVWEPLESREAVEGILQLLAQFPQVTIVVTTRNGHNPAMDKGVTWHAMEPIRPLTPDAARKLFTSLCHSQSIDDSLDDLLQAVDYIPFIIVLMATYAQEDYTTAQILELWRRRSLQRAKEPNSTRNSDMIKLDNSISMSLEGPLIKSTMNAITLVRIIAELPGGMRKNNLEKIVPAIPHAHEIVGVLVRSSLLVNTPDTLRMHTYIRSFMLRNYPLDPGYNEDVHNFYFDLIHDAGGEPGDPNFLEHIRRLQYEEVNAEAILLDALNYDFGRWAPIALAYSSYQIWNNPSINTTKAFVDLIRDHSRLSDLKHEANLVTTECSSWSRQVYQWIVPNKATNVSPALTSGLPDTSTSLLPLALLRLGMLYFRKDMYSEAIETLEDAIGESRILHQSNISAEALKVLGDIFRLQGARDYSRSLYSQACEEFDRNTRGKSSCLRGQGVLDFSLKNISGAVKLMTEAREACSPGDHACIADCDRELGRVYRDTNFPESFRLLTQARKHYLANGPSGFAAISLYQMSISLYLNGEYDEAERGFKQAITEFQSIINDAQIGFCVFHLGEMNYLRGTLPESLDFFIQSEAIFAHMDNNYMAMLSLRRQADLHVRLGQQDKANEVYESVAIINPTNKI